MVANIKITSVRITPNPVQTGKSIIISVRIEKRQFGLSTAAGRIIVNGAGRPVITTKG